MKMKKIRVTGVLLLIVAFLVTGLFIVGTKSAEAVTKIKIGHGGREDFSIQPAMIDFKKFVEKETKGSLEITIYAGTLGPDKTLTESMLLGNLDIALPTNITLANAAGIPELLLFDIPWLFPNRDSYYRVMKETKAYKTIVQKIDSKGMKYIGAGEIGAYGIIGRKAIRVPADLEGMKVRVSETPLNVDVMKALAIKPVVVNFGELFTAFQQGVMDGVFTSVPVMHLAKVYEVAKEITQMNSSYVLCFLVMNGKKFNSLTKIEQDALIKGGEVYANSMKRESIAYDKKVIAEMTKAGAKYYELTPKEIEPFKKVMAPVYTKWREKIGPEIYDETQAWIKKTYK